MNICMFGASFLPRRGGMEYVIHHLANALTDEGHNVTVIAERTAWRGIGVKHDYELVRYGVPTRGLRSMGFSAPDSLFSIWRTNLKSRFDIIHCHSSSFAGTRAIRAKRILGIPVVMTPHGEDIQRVPEIGYGLRLDEKWNDRICQNLRNADAVTAISLSVQNELDCVDPSRVVRIPNGIHTAEYGKRDSQYIREKLGLSNETMVVLSVGRNHVKKGYHFGIRAIQALRDRFGKENVHYVLVGKLMSQHAQLVSDLSLDDRVTLLEEIGPDEVKECYQSADIFFSPSIIEGLSLVSIEALACGLPLVVTDVPGNKDIVQDTGAGIIVRSKDPEDMAQGLKALIDDEQKRAILSAVAIEKAPSFDWKIIAQRYVQVYQNVLSGKFDRVVPS
jgi:glycosyltransferase involved in cell wall biosynthesis